MQYVFLVRMLSETAKSDCAMKCIGESARWADLILHLVVKANNMRIANKNSYTSNNAIFKH